MSMRLVFILVFTMLLPAQSYGANCFALLAKARDGKSKYESAFSAMRRADKGVKANPADCGKAKTYRQWLEATRQRSAQYEKALLALVEADCGDKITHAKHQHQAELASRIGKDVHAKIIALDAKGPTGCTE